MSNYSHNKGWDFNNTPSSGRAARRKKAREEAKNGKGSIRHRNKRT